MTSFQRAVVAALLGLSISAAARAQGTMAPPDVTRMRMRLGPVYLDPAIALTNAGVDTNVFNVPDSENPASDFTATVTPQANAWMPAGRTWLNGMFKEDLVWFQTYASERSVDNDFKASWLAPLTRVSFLVGGDWLSTSSRPGYEIDARAHRTERAYNGAFEFRTVSKAFIGVRGEHRRYEFDDNEFYQDVNLHNELNRTDTTAAGTFRYELTPLTSFTVDLSREQDRFDYDPIRNSNSTQLAAGLKFDPRALINGSFQLGFRDFMPLAQGLAGFRGLTSAIDLTWVLFGATKCAFGVTRDVQYSYDANNPYYVQTGVTASVTQQIFGPVDVQGRVAAARLAYRTFPGAGANNADRLDQVRSYGGGIGYHLGQDVRVAFNVDQNTRDSVIDTHDYHGLRYGVAIAYGL